MSDKAVEALSSLTPGGATRRELDRGGRTLRWIEAGEGGPTVLLDAGLATPALTWARVMPILAAHGRVLAYDRAGIGMSDPVGDLTVDSRLADLAALIEQAGAAPCVLVGHSLGGLLAQLAAWRRPDLIAGLVLVDPAHEDTDKQLVPWHFRAADTFFGLTTLVVTADRYNRLNRSTRAAKASELTPDLRVQALFVDAWAACFATQDRVRMNFDEDRAFHRAGARIREERRTARFPDVPVVVLSATTGIPERIRTGFTALQGEVAAAAGGEHIVVPNAGHYIHESKPQIVIDAILRVVEQARQAAKA
jgi:pimeloyl-ACP methyl ester carboxylesterase